MRYIHHVTGTSAAWRRSLRCVSQFPAPAQAISKYERDQSLPGSAVLIALADALGISVDYLTGDPEVVLEAIEFRKKKITSRREEAQVEGQVVHLLDRYLAIEAS